MNRKKVEALIGDDLACSAELLEVTDFRQTVKVHLSLTTDLLHGTVL
jgi:hypothetical protein